MIKVLPSGTEQEVSGFQKCDVYNINQEQGNFQTITGINTVTAYLLPSKETKNLLLDNAHLTEIINNGTCDLILYLYN